MTPEFRAELLESALCGIASGPCTKMNSGSDPSCLGRNLLMRHCCPRCAAVKALKAVRILSVLNLGKEEGVVSDG